MTTSFASALRRVIALPLIGLMVFTAACSDSSIAGPDIGNARQTGYTVPADRTQPPSDSTMMMTTTTTTTTTKGSGK